MGDTTSAHVSLWVICKSYTSDHCSPYVSYYLVSDRGYLRTHVCQVYGKWVAKALGLHRRGPNRNGLSTQRSGGINCFVPGCLFRLVLIFVLPCFFVLLVFSGCVFLPHLRSISLSFHFSYCYSSLFFSFLLLGKLSGMLGCLCPTFVLLLYIPMIVLRLI